MAGVRCCETHAPDSRQLSHGVQKFGKGLFAQWIVIGIHILTKQLNVCVAEICHLSCFGQNRVRAAAALFAAGVWNHTVGAEFVATLNNGYVSAMGIAASGKFGLKGLIGLAIVQTGYPIVSSFNLNQHLRQVSIGS